MFEKIARWFMGYLIVKLKGEQNERLINMCCHNNIYLWNISCNNLENSFEVCAGIRLKDFKQLKPILRKAHIRILINKKKGFPFLANKIIQQKTLIISIIIFTVLLYVLTLHIWHIEINGGYIHTPEQLTDSLKEIGVQYGMKSRAAECSAIEAYIRKEFPDISWVSCEKRGTNLIIQIKEAVKFEKPVTYNETAPEYAHIVAKNDGIITEIITRTGIPLVKAGDEVKAGDILVSGLVEIVGDNAVLVDIHTVLASAEIKYKTVLSYKDSHPLKFIEKKYTGNKKSGMILYAFGIKIFAYYPRNLYNEYDIINDTVSWKILNEFYLPFLHKNIFIREYFSEEKTYNANEAEQLAKERLLRHFERLSASGTSIVDYDITGQVAYNNYIMAGKVTVIQDAGIYKEISSEEYDTARKRLIQSENSD